MDERDAGVDAGTPMASQHTRCLADSAELPSAALLAALSCRFSRRFGTIITSCACSQCASVVPPFLLSPPLCDTQQQWRRPVWRLLRLLSLLFPLPTKRPIRLQARMRMCMERQTQVQHKVTL